MAIMLESVKYLRYMSDLHLNVDASLTKSNKFTPDVLFMPEPMTEDADTALLLAGDLWEAKKIYSFHNFSWLKAVSLRFKYVIFVLGNHDYYDGALYKEVQRFKEQKIKQNLHNVYLLNNECLTLGADLKIAGTTLWASFNRGNPVSIYVCENGYVDEHNQHHEMRDFRYIKDPLYSRLRAKHLIAEHIKAVNFLMNDGVRDHDKQMLIYLTHHAPDVQSIPDKKMFSAENTNEWHIAGMYYSDLSSIFQQNKPDFHIHGHTHQRKEYVKDGVSVLVNPRGYGALETDTGFDPYARIEV